MRRNNHIRGFLFIILIGVLPLFGSADKGDTLNFWIYFTDKESADAASFDASDYVFSHLTERALERRATRGTISGPSYFDLDVSQAYINAILTEGMEVRTVSRWLNAISVSAPPSDVENLEDLNTVRKVKRVRKVSKKIVKRITRAIDDELQSNTEYGGSQDQLHQINAVAAHDAGYTGADVWVLMLDTGFMTDHESIENDRIVAEYDFIQGDSVTQNQDGDHPAQHNHGTLTASVAGGYSDGNLVGVAYECNFLLAKTEIYDQEIQIEEDHYVAGLEWGEALGADIASSSLGYLDWYTYEDMDGNTAVTTQAVDIAANLGVVCVTSMGNEGNDPWYYMIAPADADSVIAVGAVDSVGLLAGFSSHGPTYDGRIKPEVVARGVLTFSAGTNSTDSYVLASGTSLSCPLVAGATALVLEANPDWTPMQVREALMMTADRAGSPDNDFGFGLVDVMAAIEYNQEQVPGDVSLDGELNINDAVLMLEWILAHEDLNSDLFEVADANTDGTLNISDVVVLIEWILTL